MLRAAVAGVCALALSIIIARRLSNRLYRTQKPSTAEVKRHQAALREFEEEIPVKGHDSPRFDVEDPKAIEYLQDNGYVVFKDVASPEILQRIKTLFWDWVETANPDRPVQRDDPETWDNIPSDLMTGIVAFDGVGQAEFMWTARGLPRVRRAFEKVWGTNELLTSFDGCGVFRPWNYNPEWRTHGGWWHVDQNVHTGKVGMQAVQGLLCVYDATDAIGGLAVIPKTHLHHAEVCERNAVFGKRDFVLIDPDDPVLKVSPARMVRARAGDLVLWDSRTIHCNTPALRDPPPYRPGDPVDLMRLVPYICMTPRSKASADTIRKRIVAYEEGITSTHWPHELYPTSNGTGRPPVPLTPEQRALVGYA